MPEQLVRTDWPWHHSKPVRVWICWPRVMSAQILDDYRSRGAAGFMPGYFFDGEGRSILPEVDDRHIVMPREDFPFRNVRQLPAR
jgi:hypothetical protein